MTWRGIVGKAIEPSKIYDYVKTISWEKWKPDFLVIHNTAAPSLADRPNGFTAQHIKNLEKYYRDDRGWPSGPHFFVDDKQIWVFTPTNVPGTHSPSWNNVSIGIEMLGDFNKEEFTSGRGVRVKGNTAELAGALLAVLGLKSSDWRWHVQDPKTTHDCPGKNARNDFKDFAHYIDLVTASHQKNEARAAVVKINEMKLDSKNLPPWGGWEKD